MRHALLIFFLAITTICNAQVTLSGRIPYAPGTSIRIYRTLDLISSDKELLTTGSADSSGNFSVQFNVDQPLYAEVIAEYYKAGLYVSPGGKYHVEFQPKDSNEVITMGREIPVSIKFIGNTDSINSMIMEVNHSIDSFFNANYELFVRKAAKPMVDKFKPVLTKRYAGANHIIQNYLKYAFAPIDEAVFRDRKTLFREYFSGRVMYSNKDYMDYFNQYFVKYLQVVTLSKCEEKTKTAIDKNRSFDDLMNVMLECDSLLKNDTLRAMVAIKGLMELYDLPKENKQNILMMLQKKAMVDKGLIGKMTSNAYDELTYLKEGSKIPVSEFVDINGKKVTIESLKGKYVYLFFWATWCDPCIQEMKVLSSYSEKYQRKVAFIGVNMDKDAMEMKRMIKRYKFSWINIHDRDVTIRDNFKVRSAPLFFMIDPDGDMLGTPPAPSENLKGYLENIMRKK